MPVREIVRRNSKFTARTYRQSKGALVILPWTFHLLYVLGLQLLQRPVSVISLRRTNGHVYTRIPRLPPLPIRYCQKSKPIWGATKNKVVKWLALSPECTFLPKPILPACTDLPLDAVSMNKWYIKKGVRSSSRFNFWSKFTTGQLTFRRKASRYRVSTCWKAKTVAGHRCTCGNPPRGISSKLQSNYAL